MALSRFAIGVITIVLVTAIIIFSLFSRDYFFASLLFMAVTILPFIIRFERRKVASRELVLLAVLGAIAAVSRIPFASIPSVQPTTFVVIVTGLVFGSESGFIVGALAALVSNLFLGQGPWTPWQMYAWGMIGLSAGLLRHTWVMKKLWGRCFFGVVAGFFFGWLLNVMSVWTIMGQGEEMGWTQIIAFYSASFPFDVAHALSNVFFLIVFSHSWIKILTRFKKKYGLLS